MVAWLAIFLGGEGEWPAPSLTQLQKESLLAMIEKATSATEVDRLAKILQTGVFPEEGLGGEEKEQEVKKKDDGETVKEEEMKIDESSVSARMPAMVPAAIPTPQRQTENEGTIDMEVIDDDNNNVKEQPSPKTTPTKTAPGRKGRGRTPTSKVKADHGKKDVNKEVAVATTPPTPTITKDYDDNKKEAQAMDVQGPKPSYPVLSVKEIKAMTVALLKKTLKARKEPTTGLKSELQTRLLASCGHTTE